MRRWFYMMVTALLVTGCGSAEQTATTGPTTVGEAPISATATAAATPLASQPAEVIPTELPTSTAAPPVEPPAAIGLELVAEGLTAPLVLTHANDVSGRLFIADQVGVIYVLGADGVMHPTPFLDLRDRMVSLDGDYDERGLLGLAFHPQFAENGRLFVYYSAPRREGAPAGWNHTSHISEFRISADPNQADAASERIILQIDQPQANHNGGQIAFGPDGYLYIPLGDGGAAGDEGEGHPPIGNGQDRTTLLGSILRIDINSGDPYSIPPDNPFADGVSGAPEIYAYGFRNPYRISFDLAGDGALYAGDVGQNAWEEVDIVTPGGNYGWNIREGAHCYKPPDGCPETGSSGEPLMPPVIEFKNANQTGGPGLVVIGGNIYRGSALPGMVGQYVFGIWSASWDTPSGYILIATPGDPNGGLWPYVFPTVGITPNGQVGAFVLSFGEDAQRELYVLTSQNLGPAGNTGQIWRIVPAP